LVDQALCVPINARVQDVTIWLMLQLSRVHVPHVMDVQFDVKQFMCWSYQHPDMPEKT
jgi:hypothetical protein